MESGLRSARGAAIYKPLEATLTWRNGRRVRLRTVWGNPWRFDSSREQALLGRGRELEPQGQLGRNQALAFLNIFIVMSKTALQLNLKIG